MLRVEASPSPMERLIDLLDGAIDDKNSNCAEVDSGSNSGMGDGEGDADGEMNTTDCLGDDQSASERPPKNFPSSIFSDEENDLLMKLYAKDRHRYHDKCGRYKGEISTQQAVIIEWAEKLAQLGHGKKTPTQIKHRLQNIRKLANRYNKRLQECAPGDKYRLSQTAPSVRRMAQLMEDEQEKDDSIMGSEDRKRLEDYMGTILGTSEETISVSAPVVDLTVGEELTLNFEDRPSCNTRKRTAKSQTPIPAKKASSGMSHDQSADDLCLSVTRLQTAQEELNLIRDKQRLTEVSLQNQEKLSHVLAKASVALDLFIKKFS